MMRGPGKIPLAALAMSLALLLLSSQMAFAQSGPGSIRVLSHSVTSEFPEGFRVKLEAQSDSDITSVALRLRIGDQAAGVYEYLDFERAPAVKAELFWRTNSSARYIPPGTLILYNFELEDASGQRMATEQQQFIYYDARFQWEEVAEGPVTVAYHGPVQTRARIILDAILETLDRMGPLLGADTQKPIRVTMYNNVKEMLEGLPPGSATIRRELITEGQAFVDIGTLLVLGSGSLAKGTASHEVTHILTHRAGDSVFRTVPSWLDEGLAEYGNIDPGFSYDIALEFALANDRLLPITSMPVLPGNPEDVIIFYGQARSLVRFMIDSSGPEKMRELMATLKTGRSIDDALQQVYGMGRIELENAWRDSIGAPRYTPPERGAALPTPRPWPTVLPYSLTPQPQAEAIGSIATPTPEPTATGTPVPSPTPAPLARELTPPSQPTTPPAGEQSQPAPGSGGGACSGTLVAGASVFDASVLALLVGLAGLGLRIRSRRR